MSDPARVFDVSTGRTRPDVHEMDLNIAEVHLELMQLLYEAGDIEARMILALARRWIRQGQAEYGKLKLNTGRDFRRESKEEGMDGIFYDLADEFERRGR